MCTLGVDKAGMYFVVTLISLSLINAASGGVYGGGSGTPQDPYQIATQQHLLSLATSTAD